MENFCKTCNEPIPLMGKTGRKRAFCSESCKLFYTNHVKKFNSLECLRDASTVNDDLDMREWAKKWCLDKKKAFRRKILEPQFIKAAGIESIALPLIDMINEHHTNEFLSKQSEKFNAWLNNSTRSICPVCNDKYPTFNQTVWRVYCSEKCCNIAKRSGGDLEQKARRTNLKRYGCAGANSKQIIEKRERDYLEKTGYSNPMFVPGNIEKAMKTRKANGFSKMSKPELDIKNYIESLGFKCEHSNWSLLCGKEIDLYVHEKKLAIEFNGCYFHSEANGGENFARNRHIEKTELCESKGVQLLHIWEDEWHNDKQKVFNLIKSYLVNIPHDSNIFIDGANGTTIISGVFDESKLMTETIIIERDKCNIQELTNYDLVSISKPRKYYTSGCKDRSISKLKNSMVSIFDSGVRVFKLKKAL